MPEVEFLELAQSLFLGEWEDGRPKRWPTLQLRIRGAGFDIYCEDRTDVTLDAFGVPVVGARTATRAELKQGWMSA
jgi:hypothetical protein